MGDGISCLQPARGQPPAGHPPRRGRRGPAHRRRALRNIPTIVFCKSRIQMEGHHRHLKECARTAHGFSGRVRDCRGGLCPPSAAKSSAACERARWTWSCPVRWAGHRHRLPHGVRADRIPAPSAAPGSRRAAPDGKDTALTILMASHPLDQYVIRTRTFLQRLARPRAGAAQPHHCAFPASNAAYELPFEGGRFGSLPDGAITSIPDGKQHFTAMWRQVLLDGGGLLPSGEIQPAQRARKTSSSLTSPTPPITPRGGRDVPFTVPMLLHETPSTCDARMFQVEKLDLPPARLPRAVDVDYYTDADLNVSLHILDDLEHRPLPCGRRSLGRCGEHNRQDVPEIQAGHHESGGLWRKCCPRQTCAPSACGGLCPTASSCAMATTRCRARWWSVANLLSIVAPLYLMCARAISTWCIESRPHHRQARPVPLRHIPAAWG